MYVSPMCQSDPFRPCENTIAKPLTLLFLEQGTVRLSVKHKLNIPDGFTNSKIDG